ncbi:MAG: hypothetical protein RIR68_163, partial [Pseudomonadota bacterium]
IEARESTFACSGLFFGKNMTYAGFEADKS